jgi:GH25 family lysozyme M1 (1,4-beta-N-acetylmuramidase)
MALGIDIYARYQTVNDWSAVKQSGVSFVYVKGTDGGGLAPVHADEQVHGAQNVGLPVGLYHYAQLSPSPETQADVLTAEVHRLGATGLPPALDLESPFKPESIARAFAQRFLGRLLANGFPTVMLYGNTSMLTGIGADTLGVPGLKVWAANYGANDGTRHGYSYGGHVDIHQYTSVGQVPGITGSVDMNESLTPITEEAMPTIDEIVAAMKFRVLAADDFRFDGRNPIDMQKEALAAAARLEVKLDALAGTLSTEETNILAAVRAQPTGGQVDVQALATALKAITPAGATPEQVTEAVRLAFAKAATP